MEEQDLSITYAVYIGTFSMLFLSFAVVGFIFLYQRKLFKKKMEIQNIEDLMKKQEIKSAYALLDGQDQERKRIASELHDNVGSILVSLNMYLSTLKSENNSEKAADLMQKIEGISNTAIAETRKLSHKLDHANLRIFGLKTAINDLFEVVKTTKQLTIQSEIHLDSPIPNDLSINIYRILQELVNNTLKHSKANSIYLDISAVNGEYVSIIYEDNGVGLKPSTTQKPKTGIGMSNIRMRVEKFGGELTVEPQEKGFSAVIEFPLS